MIGLLLALAFLFIAAYFVYKTAKQNGFNAVLWVIITIITFFGVQIALGFAIGVVIGLGMLILQWLPDTFEKFSFLINLISLATGVGGVILILRHVNKIPEEEANALPPPPSFEQ